MYLKYRLADVCVCKSINIGFQTSSVEQHLPALKKQAILLSFIRCWILDPPCPGTFVPLKSSMIYVPVEEQSQIIGFTNDE